MKDRKHEIIQIVTIAFLFTIVAISNPSFVKAIAWSSDIPLTNCPDKWDVSPSITVTWNNSIWVVWASDRETFLYELYYKTSSDYGLSWSNETRLTINASSDENPSVIQAGDGSIWIAWQSKRTGNYEIFYKTSSDYGLSWSDDIPLTTNSSLDMDPSITQDDAGTIWVVWYRNVAGNREIFYKTSSNYGLSWSDDIQLTEHSSLDRRPSITQTWDGSIWVVWESYRTENWEIFYKTSSDYGSTWSDDIPLTDNPSSDETPSVIQTMDGSIWVVWASEGASSYSLFYRTSSDYGSSWSSDIEFVISSGDDVSPSLTFTNEGKIWAVWASTRTNDFEIFYKKTSDVIPFHDVTVANVSPSSASMYEGVSYDIHVLSKNRGTETETFDVTLYCDANVIGTQTVGILDSGALRDLTFVWDTTGWEPYVDYMIYTEASVVPGEFNTLDNTCMYGTVMVKMPGDVNGDGTVDIWDKMEVHYAWGSRAEDDPITPWDDTPYWNQDTDQNNDGVIDIFDLVVVNLNYGRTW